MKSTALMGTLLLSLFLVQISPLHALCDGEKMSRVTPVVNQVPCPAHPTGNNEEKRDPFPLKNMPCCDTEGVELTEVSTTGEFLYHPSFEETLFSYPVRRDLDHSTPSLTLPPIGKGRLHLVLSRLLN